jgi:hypothetical protein
MNDDRKIWFPAKKYGWGWGAPRTWQGWVVVVVWLAAVELLNYFVRPEISSGKFFGLIVLMVIVLLAICLWKGEKPRWRWGGDD